MSFLSGRTSLTTVQTSDIADDAVSLGKLAAGTDGELISWDASGDPAAVAVGTATHVLTSNGAGAAPTFQAAGGGKVLQQAYAVLFTGITTSTAIPKDDSIPQNSDGIEVFTVAITPDNTNNVLHIQATLNVGNNAGDDNIAALFQDSTAATLATVAQYTDNGKIGSLVLNHWMVAGTTSSTTFKIRAGTAGGNSILINDDYFGQLEQSSMSVVEYEV